MHGAVALGLLHVASAAVTSWSGALDPSYDPCELAEWSCDFCEWADVHEIPVEGIFTKCHEHPIAHDHTDCGHTSWQTCGENEWNDAADQYIKASELPDGALEMHEDRMLSSATYDWATQLPLTATATVQDWTGLEEYLQERIVVAAARARAVRAAQNRAANMAEPRAGRARVRRHGWIRRV